jgi:biopolymer transport protein ExbD
MDITPMIDMTFLLLIFFMVASRIATKATVQLPAARHGDVVGVDAAVVLTVAPGGTLPDVYKGEGIDPENLLKASTMEEQDDRVTSYVDDALRSGKKYVLIQAGKGLKHREVSRVAKAVARVDFEKLYIGIVEKQ